MALSIEALAQVAGARVVSGDAAALISGVSEIESATETDLVFVERDRDLPRALASRAGAIIAGEFAAAARSNKAVLVCAQPKLSFVRAASRICPAEHLSLIHISEPTRPY